MNIRELEDSLFSEWSENNPDHFVEDGIVCEESWLKSSPKVVFVLKEANDEGGGNWDLRRLIAQGERTHTWDNITRWMYGIRNLNREVEWSEIEKITLEMRQEYLKSICAVNLKKIPGGHVTDEYNLLTHCQSDQLYLKKQFQLYSEANIIICCGASVSNYFHDYVNDYPEYQWKRTSRGVYYHEIGINKYLFEYLHPEARVGNFKNILYYGLIDAGTLR